jgi:RHS repeat-associated protein
MNMGARVYDPQIGRFLSVYPLYETFAIKSAYSYSFNNPISYSDPTGLAPEKEKGSGNRLMGIK